MGDAEASSGYGAFQLGDLHLALPMAALREVLPRGTLMPLPCRAVGVVGGVDLRGVVVPVLDLCRVLGREAAGSNMPCVIVMVHGGHILGLLADGVGGVFSGARVAGGIRQPGAEGPLFEGCIEADDGAMVSVLSPAAIAALPLVPMVLDPESGRLAPAEAPPAAPDHPADAALGAAQPVAVPMMLMRAGGVLLAIPAIAVHATLADPLVRDSALARGACHGVIDYAGAELPVVDLLAFCQLGELVRDGAHQAFVIALPQGQVAFLVDAVVDIVGTAPGDVIALAAFALPRPELFSGVLVPTARPGEAGTDPYYVIDGAALAACDEVVAWSGLGGVRAVAASAAVTGDRAAAGGPAAAAEPRRRSMLTYELGVETATPLEQVSEILAYATAQPAFDDGGALLSVLVSRGRSIPVMCLARLATGRPLESTAGASVLVVESDGEWVGFAVPALKAIEEARWQPALPAGGAGRARPLALVGEGAAERMLPVLDLWQMARSLRNDNGARAH